MWVVGMSRFACSPDTVMCPGRTRCWWWSVIRFIRGCQQRFRNTCPLIRSQKKVDPPSPSGFGTNLKRRTSLTRVFILAASYKLFYYMYCMAKVSLAGPRRRCPYAKGKERPVEGEPEPARLSERRVPAPPLSPEGNGKRGAQKIFKAHRGTHMALE